MIEHFPKPYVGAIGYTFDEGKWSIYVAEPLPWVERKSDLWVPIQPQPEPSYKWRKVNVLTPDGRVIELEQKCSGEVT